MNARQQICVESLTYGAEMRTPTVALNGAWEPRLSFASWDRWCQSGHIFRYNRYHLSLLSGMNRGPRHRIGLLDFGLACRGKWSDCQPPSQAAIGSNYVAG